MNKSGWLLALSALVVSATWAAAETEYRAAVLRVDVPNQPLPISRLDLPPPDLGFAGAALGTADNATTGSFMQQKFTTETVVATPDTAEAEMQKLLDSGVWWIVTLADEATTVKLADLAGDKAMVVNARATDDRLRGEDCRANLLHTAPFGRDADRRAGAVPRVEALDRLVPDRGQPPRGQGACRRLSAGGDEVRGDDRRGAGVRGHRRGPAVGLRHGAGAGPDARLHPACARARRGDRRRPLGRLCRAPSLSHLGAAAGGRLGGPRARELASLARGLGRVPVPVALREGGRSPGA